MSEKNFKHIVRIANADLDGNKPVLMALTKVKGIGVMYANFICTTLGISKTQKTGSLSDSDIEKMSKYVKNPEGVPSWMKNRRKDPETGEDKHLIMGDIDFTLENDLKRMKMLKSYKGIRHMHRLPVRGQRTKSNFRRNKGKVTGVKRKK